ncbi:MAG: lysophospholipid acyltransferase family protein [Candidatus Eisenbacteria bacterium]
MKKLADRVLFELAVRLGPWLIRIMGASWRITWIGSEHETALRARGTPVLYAFWHGRLLPLTYTHRNRMIRILISRSRDGEIIRRITESLGHAHVGGSTGKGGARAILRMVRLAGKGHDLAITPDGPRGPRERVQAGTILIAQRAGIPIVPLTAAASRGKTLRSWDRFRIPGLFARVVVITGAPFDVPADLSPEEMEVTRLRLERTLLEMGAEADRAAGTKQPVVETA